MNLAHQTVLDTDLKRPAQFEGDKLPSGVLALAIVGRHLGLHLDGVRILRECQFQNALLSSSDIMRGAKAASLKPTGLRLAWKDLGKMGKALPAIAMLKDGDCFVLTGVCSNEAASCVIVRDPLTGSHTSFALNRHSFESIWSGEVILLQQDRILEETKQNFGFSFIVSLVRREMKMLRDILISAVMLSLLALTPIMFQRIASERILPYNAMSTFVVACMTVAVLLAFEIIFGLLRRYLLLRMTTRIDIKLSTEVFDRLVRLPVDYFERTPAGITMHAIGQLGKIRTFLVGQLFGTVLDAGILLFFLPVMFFISPTLTFVVLIFATLICGWIILMLPIFRTSSSAVEGAEAHRGAFLSQTIQGIRTVKSLALESKQNHEWDAITAKIARLRFEEGNVANLIQAVVIPLERLMVLGSFGLGTYLALIDNKHNNSGTLFTFMLLSQRLAAPLVQASQLINQFDEARTAIGVVGNLVNREPEDPTPESGVRNVINGHVSFSKVQFQYKGALKPALREVTFEITQGTTLGVMGRSGSGKTTITRLMQRLHTDYSGLVKIDGVDIRNYNLHHFRSSLGVVLQENFLFSGTIRSNITVAKPEATFDEMAHAARLAGAEEFIDRLPNGYETYVYEGSPNLSGGQRQRLAIARALITDPKILILDEATSALDAESEAIVNANIEHISQGRTVITISHRLASLVKADAILVMEQGEVNDIGKHHELLERNEIYANLWYTQNPHTAAPAAPRPQLTYRGPQSVA